MSVSKEKRVKLKGVLDHTASSAQIRDDGSLVIEFYDFSPDAQGSFGNDVAFLLVISPKEKDNIISRLMNKPVLPGDSEERDHLLLRLIADQFMDYFTAKQWLEEQGIGFEKEFDSWA